MKKEIFISFICLAFLFTATAQKGSKTIYPLVVEFHSFCCGVPDAEPLTAFIGSFKKQQKIKKITADHIGPMGREGEYYMAFPLKELNKKQASIFIDGIKKVVPQLKDKGNAVCNENMTIDKTQLPGRATISRESL